MWGELKRINPKGKYLSNVVDGINNDADIANMFADKYRSLYQSEPTSDLEMDSLIGMINARIISMHESNNLAYSPWARSRKFTYRYHFWWQRLVMTFRIGMCM